MFRDFKDAKNHVHCSSSLNDKEFLMKVLSLLFLEKITH